jgi:primosomal protein N' (replication factor Y)
MKMTLEKKEQVLLFLNRRGFANYPVCSDCGEPVRCDNCEITLTFHKADNVYKCHFCGFTRAPTDGCPSCGSLRIIQLGLGTEKLESIVKSIFPQACVARMDHDTTRRKGSVLRLLKELKNKSIDILIGTQMVAKGHDFPNITLVGIICADLSLNFPDFRAGERTFQMLAQVAGRAGRGQLPGKVILQTYNPNHFSILAARDQDFKRFYHKEIVFRQALKYPPFSRLVQLGISGKNKEKTKRFAKNLGHYLQSMKKSYPNFATIQILGPVEAPLIKIDRYFRWQILLKSSETNLLQYFISKLIYEEKARLSGKEVKVVVDVDPFDMM